MVQSLKSRATAVRARATQSILPVRPLAPAHRRLIRARRIVGSIILAALLPGCSDVQRTAEEKIALVGAPTLRNDAARLYKDVFAGRAPEFEEVREAAWPPSFRAFAPRHVGAYPDGISLALRRSRDRESGLYIVPLHMEHAPAPTARASFQRLSEGIYWYSFEH